MQPLRKSECKPQFPRASFRIKPHRIKRSLQPATRSASQTFVATITFPASSLTVGRPPLTSLKHEIAQRQPFSSLEEEALLNLMRTSDAVQRAFHRKARHWSITSTQYNVLRILRGAQPDGLTCAAIGARMITAEPDITRLLSRLKALKLIRQRRDSHDRRVVWTQISPAGLELLAAMDPEIQQLPIDLLGHMSRADLDQLIRLLEAARKAAGEGLSCDGNEKAQQPEAAAPEK